MFVGRFLISTSLWNLVSTGTWKLTKFSNKETLRIYDPVLPTYLFSQDV